VKHVKITGHGTTGSDGIDEGIHLRWSFNDKLGFPACFKLYRRESNERDHYHFPVERLPPGLDLPYSYEIRQRENLEITIASARIRGEETSSVEVRKETLVNGAVISYIHVSGELTIRFSIPVSRIEMTFFLSASR
jgi:hypothetical protein